ncbi:hypothetical protein BGZ75_001852 [Mortierella antarctica]|nr:hypothetical protein BGZ75_001852 [Mortierella antarctica]
MLLNTITCARIDRGAGDRERSDIRSPNECAFTPQTTTFCDWSLGLELSSEKSTSTQDKDMFSSPGDTIWEKEEKESRDGSVLKPPLSVLSRRHPILAQTERAERLLVHIKEKVDDQLRLKNALWDTDALLMRYEAAVARDWEAKFVDLCQNVRELQLLLQGEPKSHD